MVVVVLLLWLRFILDIVEQNGIARKKKTSDSKRLFSIDRYLFLLLTNSTRSIAYHDVILELDCRFMDWSWRLLLSNILNDLCRDFYEAFATNASSKKNEYWTNQENGTTPIRIMGEEKQEKAKAKRINRLIRVKCQINDREMLYAADVNVCVSCGFAKTRSDNLKSTRNP